MAAGCVPRDAADMSPRASGPRPTSDLPRRTARTAAWLLVCALLTTVLVSAPASAAPRGPTPTFAYFCLDGLAKPQLCIQWSKRDVRRFDDLVAGVGATAATQWLCDKLPRSPAQLAVKAGCVAVLGLYFGRIIRTFQLAADKGQCVRLRFIIPPAAVNGAWRIAC